MAEGDTDPAVLLQRLFGAFEDEQWEEYPDILADVIVAHENGHEIRGLDEQLAFEIEFKEANPGAAVTVEDMATSGNTVFSRGVAPGGGTHLLCSHVEDGDRGVLGPQ